MEKIKIIVNPKSGREQSIAKLSALIGLISKDGYKIDLRFTTKRGDALRFASEDEGEDLIISVGGDGTLNEVVNGMYFANRKTPLAVLQCGTVNDFATVLNIPSNIKDFYNMIKIGKVMPVDLGMAGDRVFVNVAAGGFLTDIAYQVSEDKKTILGRMAYYLEGIKEVSKIGIINDIEFKKIKFESQEYKREEETLMFIIANSGHIGGFKNLAPDAEVYDGYLDVLIIKAINITDLPTLLTSILSGSHVSHEKVEYLKTKEIKISTKEKIVIDVDGEKAGKLPMTFRVLEKALNLVVN
ncbi:diacylglycerol/lipid kinase family protein [Peptoniphilus mikwangii]|uniref:diacylglycerol/lipid kinase family protein n=1 Tax=Peptoniphilus mikwangii TaxID=1354300 RepID=UPI000405311A|nr:diacylglycerol kinase family protein [Peptoniphilus mikwangii]